MFLAVLHIVRPTDGIMPALNIMVPKSSFFAKWLLTGGPGECYCGNRLSSPTASESDCSFACNGDKSQICGGFNRLSVWEDPTIEEDVAGPTDYDSLGCYTEGACATF